MNGMPVQLPPNTVVLDGHPFEEPSYLGIWRYAHRLLTGVAGRISTAVIVRNSLHRPIPEGVSVIGGRVPQVRGTWDLIRRVKRRRKDRLLADQIRYAACYHSLVYNLPPEPLMPVVTTVYDMMHEQFFHLCHPAVYPMIAAKRRAIQAAQICICISNATA